MNTHVAAPGDAGHPAACPWCGQSRVRGVTPSPDGHQWYRCGGCTTTFFIHETPRHSLALENEERRPDASH